MMRQPEMVDWQSHAGLFRLQGNGAVSLARGTLRAMIDIAMVNADDLGDLYIETDDGRMFCHREIAYVSRLTSKP